MVKKYSLIFLILLALVAGIFWIRLLSPEDSWICDAGKWVKHGQPSSPAPTEPCGAKTNPFVSEPAVTSTQTNNPNRIPTTSPNIVPKELNIKGLYVCLPKLGTGPQTEECALGLLGDNGNYYSLDTNRLGTYIEYPTGTRLQVVGDFTPIEVISSNLGRIYPVKGIITIKSVKEIE